jgi:hypothetical protein
LVSFAPAGVDQTSRLIAVSMVPGASASTWMRWLASSGAIALQAWMMPALKIVQRESHHAEAEQRGDVDDLALLSPSSAADASELPADLRQAPPVTRMISLLSSNMPS